jgi:hypothetical protein
MLVYVSRAVILLGFDVRHLLRAVRIHSVCCINTQCIMGGGYYIIARKIMCVAYTYTFLKTKQCKWEVQWNLDTSFLLPSFSHKFRLSCSVLELAPYK